MTKVFISYRRKDTADVTGRISEYLKTKCKLSVFKDVYDIEYGENFREKIEHAIKQSNVLLAVIGPRWSPLQADGQTRIFDADDHVRFEIETAISQRVRVIPLLVDGAVMPSAKELPASLQGFELCSAAQIRADPDFINDIKKVAASIRRGGKRRNWAWLAFIVSSVAIVALICLVSSKFRTEYSEVNLVNYLRPLDEQLAELNKNRISHDQWKTFIDRNYIGKRISFRGVILDVSEEKEVDGSKCRTFVVKPAKCNLLSNDYHRIKFTIATKRLSNVDSSVMQPQDRSYCRIQVKGLVTSVSTGKTLYLDDRTVTVTVVAQDRFECSDE